MSKRHAIHAPGKVVRLAGVTEPVRYPLCGTGGSDCQPILAKPGTYVTCVKCVRAMKRVEQKTRAR